jgi:hypothetical protein
MKTETVSFYSGINQTGEDLKTLMMPKSSSLVKLPCKIMSFLLIENGIPMER